LELQPTDVSLPVRQIRNANLSWVRRDAEPQGDNDELLKSLREEGMRLPILLTNELVIADGARRFLRAERLGWRTVPVVVTTEWDTVRNYFAAARLLEAEGAPHEPMTWAEIADLVNGPLDLLYRRRRLERGRASRAAQAASRLPGAAPVKSGAAKRQTDYVAEAAEILGWQSSDLRRIREIHTVLANIEAQEAARRRTHQDGDDPVTYSAGLLRGEVERLEDEGGVEGGLHTLLRRLKWVAAGNDPAPLKTVRANRKTDPTAAATQGREMDTETLAKLTRVLTGLGAEADAYTRVRPNVRVDEAQEAVRQVKVAVNQINRLTRLVRAHAHEYLEENP
jgi:hypothetical protein